MAPYGLVIHGGAGVVAPEELAPEGRRACREKLREAVDAGYDVLDRGGTALDAVVASVSVMEDSRLFNAGSGAVLNADGICELDAAVMDGGMLRAGSVAGLRHIKNPILLARAVMDKSAHVMLIGEGAERFAFGIGFESVANAQLQTKRRIEELERARKSPRRSGKLGTVGCAARDRQGNLAAGTSTGGLTNKEFGRVGDSPILGAGTYANNATCALSATGEGEYFIRACAAHDVSALMEYKGASLEAATAAAIAKVAKLGGSGGMVAIDRMGVVAMPFNTVGMYRAFRLSDGQAAVAIFEGPERAG
jgi:beta-aspartyl-peptidase (threonine type)